MKKNLLSFEQIMKIAVLVMLCALYYWVGARTEYIGLIGDDAVYLLMAESISKWFGVDGHAGFVWDKTVFPPLFPALLSVPYVVSESLYSAYVVNAVILVVAMMMVYLYVSRYVGVVFARFIFFIVALSPGTIKISLNIWSEPLYLLVSLLFFYFYRDGNDGVKYSRAGNSSTIDNQSINKTTFVLFVILSLAPLVRSIGLALIVSMVLFQIINKRYYYALLSGLCLLPSIIWGFVKPGSESGLYGSYTRRWAEIFPNTDMLDVASLVQAVVEQLHLQSSNLAYSLSELVFGATHGAFLFISVLLFIVVIIVGLIRLREKKLDALYVLLYLVILLMWPNYDHGMRFLFPLLPWILVYATLFGKWSFAYITQHIEQIPGQKKLSVNRASITFIPFILLLVVVLQSLMITVTRIVDGERRDLNGFAHTIQWLESKSVASGVNNAYMVRNLITVYKELQSDVPVGSCVYSVHNEMLMYYARRLSLTPVPKDLGYYLGSNRPCHYVLAIWMNSHPFLEVGYPTLNPNFKGTVVNQYTLDKQPDKPVIATLLKLSDA